MARDQAGWHTAALDGFAPGDPLVRVFTPRPCRGRLLEAIAEDAFALANGPSQPQSASVRGRPKGDSVALSKRVITLTRLPDRVATSSPNARQTPLTGSRR